MDLYIIHLIFISVCAGGSWFVGYMHGEKKGSSITIERFLEDGLVTEKQLRDKYSI